MRIKTIIICILEALLFLGIIIHLQSQYRYNNNINENNIIALQDSLKEIELKNGEIIYEKQSLILEKNQLEEQFELSKKELKNIEHKLQSSLDYIAELTGHIEVEQNIIIKDSIVYINDSITNYEFSYKDNWLSLNGITQTKHNQAFTNINNIYIPVPITIGLTEDKKVFVKTTNPYLTFTNVNSAAITKTILNPKPKHWNIGIGTGIGAQYGLINKTIDVGPYIGLNMSYGFNF